MRNGESTLTFLNDEGKPVKEIKFKTEKEARDFFEKGGWNLIAELDHNPFQAVTTSKH